MEIDAVKGKASTLTKLSLPKGDAFTCTASQNSQTNLRPSLLTKRRRLHSLPHRLVPAICFHLHLGSSNLLLPERITFETKLILSLNHKKQKGKDPGSFPFNSHCLQIFKTLNSISTPRRRPELLSAERGRFELPVPLREQRFSRPPLSTAQPPLLIKVKD